MKFVLISQKTPLYIAVENKNVEMVRLLLTCSQLDVNHINI